MTDRDRLIHKIMSLKKPTISLQTAMDIVDAVIDEGVIVPPFEVGTKVYVITSATSNGKNLYIFEDTITAKTFTFLRTQ